MQGKEKGHHRRDESKRRERESGFSAGQVCNQQAWADWCPSAARLWGLPSCGLGRGRWRWGLAAQLGSPATAGDASGSVPVTCRWSWHKQEWMGTWLCCPLPPRHGLQDRGKPTHCLGTGWRDCPVAVDEGCILSIHNPAALVSIFGDDDFHA